MRLWAGLVVHQNKRPEGWEAPSLTFEMEKNMSALDKQVGGGHYKDLAIQPFEYCQKNELRSGESAVIKYVTRHRDKNGKEDLEKAKHIIDMIIEMDYPDA